MPDPLPIPHDRSVDGPRSRLWRLDAQACRELALHRIARIGFDEALPPYERVRPRPAGSFIMACVEGSGAVLLDGSWQRVSAGRVCMAPPRVLNAFRADRAQRWRFAWLRYDEAADVVPVVGAASPVKLRGGADLADALLGLRREWEAQRDPVLVHHWIELLQGCARRLAQPFQREERLRQLWQKVERAPGEDWSLKLLAHEAHVSPEHLRRLCLRELGRTPMQQVTMIRVSAARHRLEQGRDKLEVVARELGYANAFVFSRVFKRVTGMPPAGYRGRVQPG